MAEADTRAAAIDSRAGWLIVLVGFLLLFTLWGMIYTFTVYSAPLGGAFGLSGLRTSSVFSTGLAVFFTAGGIVGILAARLPYRPVIAGAAGAVVGGIALLQVVGSYFGLLVSFAMICGAVGTVYVLVLSIVPQWFDVYEGRAMGITVVGNGLGVQVMPFVWLWLLERVSIRRAFLVVGGAGVIVMVLAALIFRRPPAGQGEGSIPVDRSWLRSLFGNPRFLAAWVGLILVWAWYFVLSAEMVNVLTGAGIVRTVAATAFGLVGGVSIVSRVASGAVADRIGPRRTQTGGVVLAAAGLFMIGSTPSVVTMYVAIITFGAGLGAIAALYAPIVIRAFDPENATAVTGVFTFSNVVAGFLGPLGISALATTMGGYDVPITGLGVLTLAGAGLFYWGTRPDV